VTNTFVLRPLAADIGAAKLRSDENLNFVEPVTNLAKKLGFKYRWLRLKGDGILTGLPNT